MHLLLSSLAAFLPQPWRRNIPVSMSAAAISGAAEFVFCLGALIYRYLTFAHLRMVADMEIMLKAAQRGGETAVMGSGLFLLLEYLLQPLTILLCYFALEGVVRTVAAAVTQETPPSLPLYLLLLAQQKLSRLRRERALGERIVDEVNFVESSPLCLRIASCRPKEAWGRLTTIVYQDQLYELAAAQEGNPPRPFVYLLRRKPEHKIVRGIHYYDPEETLDRKQ